MTHDLISDMLTCIRNASAVKHIFTYIKYTKLNLNILLILINEGYIKNYSFEKINRDLKIKIFLKYKGWWLKKSYFSIIKRISKPGKRIFTKYKDLKKNIPTFKYSQGIAIISTSSGLMTHLKALKLKKGGEILCYIE